ncbi:hypothetical protein ACJX0J_024912, partial [Zea mays]
DFSSYNPIDFKELESKPNDFSSYNPIDLENLTHLVAYGFIREVSLNYCLFEWALEAQEAVPSSLEAIVDMGRMTELFRPQMAIMTQALVDFILEGTSHVCATTP